MPQSDRDIFDHLASDDDTASVIGFLAYSIYAFEKCQWHDQFVGASRRAPDAAETDRWISDITAIRLVNFREEAARIFDESARDYLGDDIEAQKQAAVRNSILAEVKAAGAFWKQLAVALLTAILAPLIIGGVIAAWLTYDRAWPTATDCSQRLLGPPAPAALHPAPP